MENQVLFETMVTQWLEKQKQIIKLSSYETYSQWIWNHLVPKFGKKKISEISRKDIQEFIFELADHGRKDNQGGLSNKTIKGMITILNSMLTFASEYYSIFINPGCFSKMCYPKNSKERKPKVFSLQEQKIIQDYIIENLSYQNFGVMLAFQTGVRIGELCALQFRDIDFVNKTISISKTIQRISHAQNNKRPSTEVIVSSPKTDTSNRIIPMAAILLDLFEKLLYNSKECYVVTGTEHYIEPRNYYYFYRKLLNEAHINYVNFHTTRHTFATRCIEAGCDCKTVSDLLGHASVKTTLDLYMHPQLEQKRLCIEQMSQGKW